MAKKIKVRLKTDLKKYLSGLVEGTEGFTVGTEGIWSRNSDSFVSVNFPGKGTIDVLWKSLEIIDEEYLKEKEQQDKVFLNELKTASGVVKYVGPRGGFRYLSYNYISSDGGKISTSLGFKSEAEDLIKIFEGYGITVTEKTVK